MDGQHRMEAAKIIGLKKVPCILYDYKKVDIYSLRPKEFKKLPIKIFTTIIKIKDLSIQNC